MRAKNQIDWSVGSMTMEAALRAHVKLPTLQDLNLYVVYGNRMWDVNENLEAFYLHLSNDGPDEEEMTETQKIQHVKNLVQVISKGISSLDASFSFSKLAKIKLKSYVRFKKNIPWERENVLEDLTLSCRRRTYVRLGHTNQNTSLKVSSTLFSLK